MTTVDDRNLAQGFGLGKVDSPLTTGNERWMDPIKSDRVQVSAYRNYMKDREPWKPDQDLGCSSCTRFVCTQLGPKKRDCEFYANPQYLQFAGGRCPGTGDMCIHLYPAVSKEEWKRNSTELMEPSDRKDEQKLQSSKVDRRLKTIC